MLALEWLLAKTGQHSEHLAADTQDSGSVEAVRLAKRALLAEPAEAANFWQTLEQADQNADFAAFSLIRLRAEAQDEHGTAAGLAAFSSRLIEPTATAMLLKEAAERGESKLEFSQRLALWQRITELVPRCRAWQPSELLRTAMSMERASLIF